MIDLYVIIIFLFNYVFLPNSQVNKESFTKTKQKKMDYFIILIVIVIQYYYYLGPHL